MKIKTEMTLKKAEQCALEVLAASEDFSLTYFVGKARAWSKPVKRLQEKGLVDHWGCLTPSGLDALFQGIPD